MTSLRAAFERHAERLGYSVDPDTREGREGGYWSSHTQLMWLTWQAALAESPVDDPHRDHWVAIAEAAQKIAASKECGLAEAKALCAALDRLTDADRVMGHDDESTEWRERWAHLFSCALTNGGYQCTCGANQRNAK